MMEDSNYRYLVVRKTGKSLRNSVFLLLTDLISEYNLSGVFRVNKTEMSITCVNGSSLITSGLDDVEKLKSIANVNRIWVEEASEISETDFNQLDLRLRGQSEIGYQMTVTFNPVSETHWLKKSFFDIGRPDSYVLKTTYEDNKFLDEQYIQTLLELKNQDYNYYRVYALGEWGSIGSVIFSNWEQRDLYEIKDSFDNIYYGIDFGYSDDPTAFIAAHYDSSKKEIYIIDEMYRYEHFIDEIAEEVRPIVDRAYVTCDTEPRSIADLNRHRVRAKAAKKGKGSVEHGVKFLQSNKIIIDKSCTNAIKEISGYRWQEDKDGNPLPRPVDKDNHLIDALRYALEDAMRDRTVRARKNILF